MKAKVAKTWGLMRTGEIKEMDKITYLSSTEARRIAMKFPGCKPRRVAVMLWTDYEEMKSKAEAWNELP
jgi:hypothetical protein